MSEHLPVLLEEVIEGLNINPQGTYVDLTLGRAGHSTKILEKLTSGKLIGFDQDQEAIKASNLILAKLNKDYLLVHANFKKVKEELAMINISEVDGVLMDLGVSSPQFDEGERGFSYRFDARLDMRMNQEQSLDAHYIVNNYELSELTKIMREYGDEKYAYEIAKKIIVARQQKNIDTTLELVDIIKSSLPKKVLQKKGHPAKQVFQSLRIATNDEYSVLRSALVDILGLLKVGGRLAVITFHSGEDRIVKHIFKEKCVVKGTRRGPMLRPDEEVKPQFKMVNAKVVVASEEELTKNPRAESAKLRIIEKL